MMRRILFVDALGVGLLITYIDTRPYWDDTGVTAALLLVASGTLGFLGPDGPWLWALVVGIWIPLIGMVRSHDYLMFLPLTVTFLGAYVGMGMRKVLFPRILRS